MDPQLIEQLTKVISTSIKSESSSTTYTLAGLIVLLILQYAAYWTKKVRKSSCWGVSAEFNSSSSSEDDSSPRETKGNTKTTEILPTTANTSSASV